MRLFISNLLSCTYCVEAYGQKVNGLFQGRSKVELDGARE